MLNKVQLIGHLGKDPEVRVFANGDVVANVTLATTETWKDKQGKRQEKTGWHNLVFYRSQAEVVSEYLKKGAFIYVEGKLTTEKYEKNGEDRYITKIAVSEMRMLGGNNKATDENHNEAPPPQSSQSGGKTKGNSETYNGQEPF